MTDGLKDVLVTTAIFLSAVGIFVGGFWLGAHRPVASCQDFAVAQDVAAVMIPMLPNGTTEGAKCVTIRGYFEGLPSGWRYVGMPRR